MCTGGPQLPRKFVPKKFLAIIFSLQNLLNFTYKLRPPPDRQWGAKRADGSWTGIIGELDEKRADICERKHVYFLVYNITTEHILI